MNHTDCNLPAGRLREPLGYVVVQDFPEAESGAELEGYIERDRRSRMKTHITQQIV